MFFFKVKVVYNAFPYADFGKNTQQNVDSVKIWNPCFIPTSTVVQSLELEEIETLVSIFLKRSTRNPSALLCDTIEVIVIFKNSQVLLFCLAMGSFWRPRPSAAIKTSAKCSCLINVLLQRFMQIIKWVANWFHGNPERS